MKKIEWVREAVSGLPDAKYVQERQSAGWRIAAIEWEREIEEAPAGAGKEVHAGEEIPYGTRIANDCLHLEENPTEVYTRARESRGPAWRFLN